MWYDFLSVTHCSPDLERSAVALYRSVTFRRRPDIKYTQVQAIPGDSAAVILSVADGSVSR